MPQIGLDGHIVLDGTGYFIQPGSYKLHQPRIRKATIRADGGEAYIDLGPGKRVWSMVILCLNDLVRYDGVPTGITGQQYRDALRASYARNIGGTINYSDPINGTVAVHFDNYTERIIDLHSQITTLATGGTLAASYEVAIELVES